MHVHGDTGLFKEGHMAEIQNQKLLYHLTDFSNLKAIFSEGLKPRSELSSFSDVADSDILDGRKALSLETKVPFHFFARNPFDGRVQQDHPDKEFVLIAVTREMAEANNWSVIPRHPLSSEKLELLEYKEGMEQINWTAMNQRDYQDEESKSVCMAECLSPSTIEAKRFSNIFTPDSDLQKKVIKLKSEFKLGMYVNSNSNMFLT